MTFGNPIESFNLMSVVNKTDMKESKNDHRNKSPIKSKRQIEKVKLSENRKLLNLRIDDSSAETTTFKFDYIISILDNKYEETKYKNEDKYCKEEISNILLTYINKICSFEKHQDMFLLYVTRMNTIYNSINNGKY